MSQVNESIETEQEQSTSSLDKAIVLDLGKKKRKLIKQLRKGRGKLLDQVEDHLDELRAADAIDASAQTVIVVVSEKGPKVPWL